MKIKYILYKEVNSMLTGKNYRGLYSHFQCRIVYTKNERNGYKTNGVINLRV